MRCERTGRFRTRRRRRSRNRGESGIALISALLLVMTGTLLAGSVMILSRINMLVVRPHVQMQRSYYVCEGMANRAWFLIAADRQLNNAGNAQLQLDNYGEYDYDRYLPDGVPHFVDYYGTPMQFVILDASGPPSMTGNDYSTTLRSLLNNRADDSEWSDLITRVTNRIQDYVDSNDTAEDDSSEETEYADAGMAPLPRNAAIEQREEFLWIDELCDLFPPDADGRLTSVRLIPPRGYELTGDPDIFSVTDDYLDAVCGLEEEEILDVRDSIARLHSEDREPLSETMDSGVLTRVSQYFRWTPSGNYTVVIRPVAEAKTPGKRLSCTFATPLTTGAVDSVAVYFEWTFF